MSLAGSSLLGEIRLEDGWAAEYEPLVRSTTLRWCGRTELDPEDFAQELRLKVWQALNAYDPARSSMPERNYVFSLVFNRVKDLLARKKRAELYIEDVAPSLRADGGVGPRDRFEARHLADSGYEVGGLVGEGGFLLPDRLSDRERAVLLLRYMDVPQVEMPSLLGCSLREVKSAMRAVRAAGRVELGWPEDDAERSAPLNGEVKRFPGPRLAARREREVVAA